MSLQQLLRKSWTILDRLIPLLTQTFCNFSMAKPKKSPATRKPPARQAKNGVAKAPGPKKQPQTKKTTAPGSQLSSPEPGTSGGQEDLRANIAALTNLVTEQGKHLANLTSSFADFRNQSALRVNHTVTDDGEMSVAGSDVIADHSISGEVPVPIAMTHSDSHLNVPKFSPGLPAGQTVKHDLKVKLWSHKFIEFYDLLYPNITPTYSMSFQGDSGNPHLMLAPKKRKTLNEVEWGMACDIFVAIYVERYPEQLSALLTYSRHVKDLMRHKADWRYYDEEYRRAREFSPHSFFTVRQDLELRAFRKAELAKNMDQNSNKASNSSHVPSGFCFKFHKRDSYCNLGESCNFSHQCSRCKKTHPMYRPCHQNTTRGPSASRTSPNPNKRQGPQPSPARVS